MKLTGTLWRVKVPGYGFDGRYRTNLAITPRPAQIHALSTEQDELTWLDRGAMVLVGGEAVQHQTEPLKTYLPVLLPKRGFMVQAYFTKDSLWLERVG
jgi:hypothetical protein